jgi:signal transduction histidine kinase
MQQVLINLLTNAARYGGPHRLVRVVATGSDLVLEVHDDGEGIPRRYEVRVWDRFERGPNRLNASVPGSGIGLSIVLAIADAHGGTANYRRSERLGGACFEVYLPGRASITADTRQLAELSASRSIRPVV